MRVEYLNMSGSGLDPYEMVSKGKVDVSFQTTIFSESTTTLEVPEGLQAIWIPEFHGELVIGVAKNSELASRECVALRDLSGERFILQAALHAELFRKQFIAMCHEEGFYPNITLVTPTIRSIFTAAIRETASTCSRMWTKRIALSSRAY